MRHCKPCTNRHLNNSACCLVTKHSTVTHPPVPAIDRALTSHETIVSQRILCRQYHYLKVLLQHQIATASRAHGSSPPERATAPTAARCQPAIRRAGIGLSGE